MYIRFNDTYFLDWHDINTITHVDEEINASTLKAKYEEFSNFYDKVYDYRQHFWKTYEADEVERLPLYMQEAMDRVDQRLCRIMEWLEEGMDVIEEMKENVEELERKATFVYEDVACVIRKGGRK